MRALLNCPHPGSRQATGGADARAEPDVPEAQDALATIAALAISRFMKAIRGSTGNRDQARHDAAVFTAPVGARMVRRSTAWWAKSLQRRAKLRLDAGAASITDIAFELGYRDPAHFTRASPALDGRLAERLSQQGRSSASRLNSGG